MNNCMSGTSIIDLQKQQEEKNNDINNYNIDRMTQYNANQNLQYEQGHNDAYSVMQNQQDPYYNMRNVINYPNNPQIDSNIEKLANDITTNMPGNKFSENILNDLQTETIEELSHNTNYNHLLKKYMIILVIYIILSLPYVRITLGKLIPMINPNIDGNVPISGIIIYGVLLIALVALTNNILRRF
jgi:hypothetical protein